jgi:predicted Zn-dependent protease
MHRLSIKSLSLLLLLGVITSVAYAESPIYSWQVNELARSPVEKIKLRNEQDRLIKTVSAKQMVYLYAAMSSIADASEINAEFIIVDGELANAFAASTEEGQNFVAINFAMLEILGTNLDMAAALIGHELAHLKLNHGEISKKNMEQNRGKDFSIANTRYSRDNEREADYLGAIWAVEAGYDPKGAVALQEALYAQSKKILSTSFNVSHPSSIERITVLKSLVRRLTN